MTTNQIGTNFPHINTPACALIAANTLLVLLISIKIEPFTTYKLKCKKKTHVMFCVNPRIQPQIGR